MDQPTTRDQFEAQLIQLLDFADFEKCLELSLFARNAFPGEGWAVGWHLHALRENSNHSEERSLAKEVQSSFSECAEVRFALAHTSLLLGDLERAQEHAKAGIALDPTNFLAYSLCLDLAGALEDSQRVLQVSEELLSKFPSSPAAHAGRCTAFRTVGLMDDANGVVAIMTEKWPTCRRTYFHQAQTAAWRKDMIKARQILEEAVQTYPNDARLISELAKASRRTGDLGTAETLARRAYELSPLSFSVLTELASTLQALGKAKEAEQYDVLALKSWPIFAASKCTKQARALQKDRKPQQAIDLIDGYIASQGEHVPLRRALIIVRTQAAEDLGSPEVLSKAIRIAEEAGVSDQALLNHRAKLATIEGRIQEAERLHLSVIENSPSNLSSRARLIELYASQGQSEKVQGVATEIVNATECSEPAQYLEAFMQLENHGFKEEANSVLARAEMLFPDHKDIRVCRATLNLEAGDISALKELRESGQFTGKSGCLLWILGFLMKGSRRK